MTLLRSHDDSTIHYPGIIIIIIIIIAGDACDGADQRERERERERERVREIKRTTLTPKAMYAAILLPATVANPPVIMA